MGGREGEGGGERGGGEVAFVVQVKEVLEHTNMTVWVTYEQCSTCMYLISQKRIRLSKWALMMVFLQPNHKGVLSHAYHMTVPEKS